MQNNQPVAARALAVRQARRKPSEAIAMLQTWLAPIDIRLPGGGTEPFEPALIGPLQRKYLRRILDTMIELEAKTHGAQIRTRRAAARLLADQSEHRLQAAAEMVDMRCG